MLLTNQNRIYIKDLAHKYFKNNIFEKDSNAYKLFPSNNIKNQIYKFINDLAKRKLVITDRLHVSIFSVIISKPCIIFGNNYHKVESSYNSWFNKLDYILLLNKMKFNQN